MIGGDDITKNDLVISKLLGQNIKKYRSLFPHVSAAIQLSNGDRHPSKGDTIKYIYTDSQHKNPLCRVPPSTIQTEAIRKKPLVMIRKNTEKLFLTQQKRY